MFKLRNIKDFEPESLLSKVKPKVSNNSCFKTLESKSNFILHKHGIPPKQFVNDSEVVIEEFINAKPFTPDQSSMPDV